MKIKHIFALHFLLFFGFVAAHAQAIQKGQVMIDGYYGFPNLTTSILKVVVREVYDSPDLTAKGIGTFGMRGSYMLSNHFGLGLDVYYARSTVNFTHTFQDSTLGTQSFAVRLDNPRPRFLLRADYHFGNLEKADFYASLGLGVNAAHFKITTQDPYFDKNSLTLPGLIPVAYRLAIGTKIYPIPNLGFGAELGIGGPLVTAGITGKFGTGGGNRYR
jgi:hypothetical protein